MPESFDPYRDAVTRVLPPSLQEELAQAEKAFQDCVKESNEMKVRATENIRVGSFDRPKEVMLAELDVEYAERVRYFQGKLAKKVRWILEAYKDTPEDE